MHHSFPCKEMPSSMQLYIQGCHSGSVNLFVTQIANTCLLSKTSNMLPSPSRGSNELLSSLFAATELLMLGKLKGCELLQLSLNHFQQLHQPFFPLLLFPPYLFRGLHHDFMTYKTVASKAVSATVLTTQAKGENIK